MKLGNRLILGFILVVFISIFLVSFISFNRSQEALEQSIFMELEVIADLKVDKITTFFNERESDMKVAQHYFNIRRNLPRVAQLIDNRTNPEYIMAKTELDSQLKRFPKIRESYIEVLLLNSQGEMVYTTENVHKEDELGTLFPAKNSFEQGREQIHFSEIFPSPFFEGFEMLISAPIYDFDENFIGVMIFAIDMRTIYEFIQDNTGLGETGETLIGKYDSTELEDGIPWHEHSFEKDHVVFLNPIHYDPDAALKREIAFGDEFAIPIQKATQGEEGHGFSIDYRNEEVLAAWKPIPSMNWGLVSKIDTKEAFAPINRLRFTIILFSIVIALLASLYAFLFSISITKPIIKLKQATTEIGKGKLDTRIEINAKDEIGELAADFNKMAQDLKLSQKQIRAYAKNLEKEVQERTAELKKEKEEAEDFANLAAGRELKMIELKEIIKKLKDKPK